MIDYVNLVECDSDRLLSILNSKDVRKHLMPHDQFIPESLTKWIAQKKRLRRTCRLPYPWHNDPSTVGRMVWHSK